MSNSFLFRFFDFRLDPFRKIFRQRRVCQYFSTAGLLNLPQHFCSLRIHKSHSSQVHPELLQS